MTTEKTSNMQQVCNDIHDLLYDRDNLDELRHASWALTLVREALGRVEGAARESLYSDVLSRIMSLNDDVNTLIDMEAARVNEQQ